MGRKGGAVDEAGDDVRPHRDGQPGRLGRGLDQVSAQHHRQNGHRRGHATPPGVRDSSQPVRQHVANRDEAEPEDEHRSGEDVQLQEGGLPRMVDHGERIIRPQQILHPAIRHARDGDEQ